ncbi:hypothetical protein AN1V17_06390 [Vallitalea sediminicola]
MQFGRSEGINECGLMVGQTSCGMPVGNMEMMRKPAISGLQFWAVIRSLLENCKDVDEALIISQMVLYLKQFLQENMQYLPIEGYLVKFLKPMNIFGELGF